MILQLRLLLDIKHMQLRHNFLINNIRNIINNNSNNRQAGHSKDIQDQEAVRRLDNMVTMNRRQQPEPRRVVDCRPILTLFPYTLNTHTSLAQVSQRRR